MFSKQVVKYVLDQKNGDKKECAGHHVVIADEFEQLIGADRKVHGGVRWGERLIEAGAEDVTHQRNELQGSFIVHIIEDSVGFLAARKNSLLPQNGKML